MNTRELILWLDGTIALEGDRADKSMLSRSHLIPQESLARMNAAFRETMNGCAMLLSEETTRVFFSVFLTEAAVDRVCASTDGMAMLVVHHLFDMHCGNPGTVDAIPFHFIGTEAFQKLLDCGVSLYSAHLPLDRQPCPFNTSLSFAASLGFCELSPLSLSQLPSIGYAAETKLDLAERMAERYPVTAAYGKPYSFSGAGEKTAFIGGVVGSGAVAELESLGFDNLVCGDVLVRTGEKRYADTLRTVSDSRLSILCASHLKSEETALIAGAERMKNAFPSLELCYLPEYTDWK